MTLCLFVDKCFYDGIFYYDPYSIIVCANGYGYVQPCPDGTRNREEARVRFGDQNSLTAFCDENLVGYKTDYIPKVHPTDSYGLLGHGRRHEDTLNKDRLHENSKYYGDTYGRNDRLTFAYPTPKKASFSDYKEDIPSKKSYHNGDAYLPDKYNGLHKKGYQEAVSKPHDFKDAVKTPTDYAHGIPKHIDYTKDRQQFNYGDGLPTHVDYKYERSNPIHRFKDAHSPPVGVKDNDPRSFGYDGGRKKFDYKSHTFGHDDRYDHNAQKDNIYGYPSKDPKKHDYPYSRLDHKDNLNSYDRLDRIKYDFDRRPDDLRPQHDRKYTDKYDLTGKSVQPLSPSTDYKGHIKDSYDTHDLESKSFYTPSESKRYTSHRIDPYHIHDSKSKHGFPGRFDHLDKRNYKPDFTSNLKSGYSYGYPNDYDYRKTDFPRSLDRKY